MSTRRWQLHAALFWLLAACGLAAHAQTWLIDFGSAAHAPGPGYNKVTNPGVHTVAGLVDSANQATAVSLSITVPFNTSAPNLNGTTTPTPDVGMVPNATRDSFFGNTAVFNGQSAPRAQLVLSGLDPARIYDFSVFASRMGAEENRQTVYRLTGMEATSLSLDPKDNEARTAVAFGVRPRADGTVVLDVQAGSSNLNAYKFFYLGAMKVVGRAPPTCGTDAPALDDRLTAYPTQPGTTLYPLSHWLYRPAGYSSNCGKVPLLVFLHGAGELCPEGTLSGLNKPGLNSPGHQIVSGIAQAEKRPFLQGLVLQPLACRDAGWHSGSLHNLIAWVKSTHRVDEDRIYITGLSLGGGGTWGYAAAYPHTLAAMVPIAGTSTAMSSIERASHVPTWAFHNYADWNDGVKGDGDGLNPPDQLFRCGSRANTHRLCTVEHIDRMVPFASTRVLQGYSAHGGATMASETRVAALTATSGATLPTQWVWTSGDTPVAPITSRTLVTIYTSASHDAWSRTYALPAMWEWLYQQRRSVKPSATISSETISPAVVTLGSGGTLTITAKVGAPGSSVTDVCVDLKAVGGAHDARMLRVAGTPDTYTLQHTLPPTGLSVGHKAIGLVAIDGNGQRTVKYLSVQLQ